MRVAPMTIEISDPEFLALLERLGDQGFDDVGVGFARSGMSIVALDKSRTVALRGHIGKAPFAAYGSSERATVSVDARRWARVFAYASSRYVHDYSPLVRIQPSESGIKMTVLAERRSRRVVNLPRAVDGIVELPALPKPGKDAEVTLPGS